MSSARHHRVAVVVYYARFAAVYVRSFALEGLDFGT